MDEYYPELKQFEFILKDKSLPAPRYIEQALHNIIFSKYLSSRISKCMYDIDISKYNISEDVIKINKIIKVYLNPRLYVNDKSLGMKIDLKDSSILSKIDLINTIRLNSIFNNNKICIINNKNFLKNNKDFYITYVTCENKFYKNSTKEQRTKLLQCLVRINTYFMLKKSVESDINVILNNKIFKFDSFHLDIISNELDIPKNILVGLLLTRTNKNSIKYKYLLDENIMYDYNNTNIFLSMFCNSFTIVEDASLVIRINVLEYLTLYRDFIPLLKSYILNHEKEFIFYAIRTIICDSRIFKDVYLNILCKSILGNESVIDRITFSDMNGETKKLFVTLENVEV